MKAGAFSYKRILEFKKRGRECPRRLNHTLKSLLKAPKSIKSHSSLKKTTYFLRNEKQVRELFYEINPDISVSKTTFKPSGKTKILPKTTSDYFLIHNYVFSSAIHRIPQNQIAIEEYI